MEPYSSDDIKRKKRRNSNILNNLLGAIPGLTSVFIVSSEGFPIAYALPQGVDEAKIAAMTAALFSLSKMANIEMGKGDFDQFFIKGSEGYLLIMQAGPHAILMITTTKDVRLGLILLDFRRICEKIAQMGDDIMKMEGGDDEDGFPFPYISKPPEPPEDFEMGAQFQVKKSMNKEPEYEIYCQYCGKNLSKEERFSHNCKKKP